LRRLRRHWRLNLAVLLGLTLAVALLASLPTYAAAIAARGLKQSLQDAPPAGRSLLVVNSANQTSAGLYGMIQDALGELLQRRVQVRERYVAFESLLVPAPGDDGELHTQAITPPRGPHRGRSAEHMVWLWTLDQLADSVRLVEGRMPRTASQEEAGVGPRPPPMAGTTGHLFGRGLAHQVHFWRRDTL
jgi:hypothetical protein